jgi:hypothetical protein
MSSAKKLIIPRREAKQVLSLRLKPSRLAALKKAAKANDCTVNALLEAVVDEWLHEQGMLKS